MASHAAGTILICAGVILVGIGLLVWTGAFRWFGSLPGDIKIERESFRFYFPVVSLILLSIVVSFALRLLRRWF